MTQLSLLVDSGRKIREEEWEGPIIINVIMTQVFSARVGSLCVEYSI